MFTIKNVRIVSCEAKDYEFNGKKGKWYPTMIRIDGNKVFSMSSKSDLTEFIDKEVDLEFEFQEKQSKTGGSAYVSPRILGLAQLFGSDNLEEDEQ